MKNTALQTLVTTGIIVLAQQFSVSAQAQDTIPPYDSDALSYVPVTPCRIFDTRTSEGGTGKIPAFGAKSFFVYGSAGAISAQGGIGTGCAAPPGRGEPVAAHLNITAAESTGNGNIRVYPKGTPSTSSTLNFRTGVPIANAISVKTKFDVADSDITVEARGASVDVLADVQGYYYPVGQSWSYAGYDLFGAPNSGVVISGSTATNAAAAAEDTPSMVSTDGDNIYYSATVAVRAQSTGNVLINMYACRLAANTTTPILQRYNTGTTGPDQEVEACYANQSSTSYFLVPISGVITDVPEGNFEYSICADQVADVPCASPQNYRTWIQNMTVINLGK